MAWHDGIWGFFNYKIKAYNCKLKININTLRYGDRQIIFSNHFVFKFQALLFNILSVIYDVNVVMQLILNSYIIIHYDFISWEVDMSIVLGWSWLVTYESETNHSILTMTIKISLLSELH